MEQIQGLQLDIHILNGRGKHIQIQMFEKYKYGKRVWRSFNILYDFDKTIILLRCSEQTHIELNILELISSGKWWRIMP